MSTAELPKRGSILAGTKIYRRRVGTTLSLERQTLHVSDETKRIVLFETKTVDVDNPAGLPQVRVRWQLDNHLESSGTELDIENYGISTRYRSIWESRDKNVMGLVVKKQCGGEEKDPPKSGS